jgi:hypothetical protein
MKLISTGDVQYVNVYYTPGMMALCGDRRNSRKSHAIFQLYQDSANKKIVLKITEVSSEVLRIPQLHRVDIYILQPGAEILMTGLSSLTAEITAAITLDRSIRDPKDSRYSYDDSGLPLRIDAIEGWVKLSEVSASFSDKGFAINCDRMEADDDLPKMNIDVETVGSKRLHLGIQAIWATSTSVDDINNITITIPWTEFAHLLSGIRNSIPKFK